MAKVVIVIEDNCGVNCDVSVNYQGKISERLKDFLSDRGFFDEVKDCLSDSGFFAEGEVV